MNDSLRSILREAQQFRNSANRPMNYHDYERFKQKLYDEGLYGYECRLANLLKL